MLSGRILYHVPKLFLFPPTRHPIPNRPSISALTHVEVAIGLFRGRALITRRISSEKRT